MFVTKVTDKLRLLNKEEVTEYCYTWTIPNFHDYLDKSPHTVIESPEFLSKYVRYRWVLKIHPCRIPTDDDIILSANPHVLSDLHIYVLVSLINAEKEEVVVAKVFTKLVQRQSEIRVKTFLREKLLSNEKNNFLPNNELTIRWKLYFNCGHPDNVVPTCEIDRLREFNEFERLLLEEDQFSDITLIAGGKEFRVHKNILAVRSRVFAAMFSHDMKEANKNHVEIDDVSAEVMTEVLRFIYCGKVNSIATMGIHFLVVADKYDLRGLKNLCEQELIKQLTAEDIVEIISLAERHNADKLLQTALKFCVINAKEVIHTDKFKNIMKPCLPWVLDFMNMLVSITN